MKGLRDVRTAEGLAARSLPRTRAGKAAQLARLEHERAALQRALVVLAARRRQAEERMGRVERLIEEVEASLVAEQRQAPQAHQEPDGRAAWPAVELEY